MFNVISMRGFRDIERLRSATVNLPVPKGKEYKTLESAIRYVVKPAVNVEGVPVFAIIAEGDKYHTVRVSP